MQVYLRDADLILGLGRYPGEENGNPLQYSCQGLGSLVGYSPWGRKELDTTEWLSTAHYMMLSAYQAPYKNWSGQNNIYF